MNRLPAHDDPYQASINVEIDSIYVQSLTPNIDPIEWSAAISHLYTDGPTDAGRRWVLADALRTYPHISTPAMTAAVKYVNTLQYLEDLGIYSDD
jgi:hypothetical protein